MSVLCKFIFIFMIVACSSTISEASGSQIIEGPIKGEVLNVIDGDTLSVKMNVWLDQQIEVNLRVVGIDTPELRGKCDLEKTKAKEARSEIIKLIKNDAVKLYNIRHDKYAGRVLANVQTATGIDLAEYMISKGFARPYKGDKRQGWCE